MSRRLATGLASEYKLTIIPYICQTRQIRSTSRRPRRRRFPVPTSRDRRELSKRLDFTNKLQTNLLVKGKLQNNLPKKPKSDRDLFYRFATLIIRFIFRINGGLDVKNIYNVPAEGGVIIASNHLSYLDPPLLAAVVPRRATFMARKGLFNIPLLGWFIKHYAFPVDREKTLPSTIKEAIKRVKNGELLIMFPEGRRSETGRLLEGKRGIGIVASLSKASVVPTLIIGSNKVLPVGAKWLRRSKISIIFDRPINLSIIERKDNNIYENISQKIMCAIGELKKHHADNSS